MEGQLKLRLLGVVLLGASLGFTLQTGSASAEDYDAGVSEQSYLLDGEVQEGVAGFAEGEDQEGFDGVIEGELQEDLDGFVEGEFLEDVEGFGEGEIQEGVEGFVEIEGNPAEDENR